MTALADDGVIAALEIREASGPGEQGVSIDLPVEFDFIRIKLDDGRIIHVDQKAPPETLPMRWELAGPQRAWNDRND